MVVTSLATGWLFIILKLTRIHVLNKQETCFNAKHDLHVDISGFSFERNLRRCVISDLSTFCLNKHFLQKLSLETHSSRSLKDFICILTDYSCTFNFSLTWRFEIVGNVDAAMKTALHLTDYDDIIDPLEIYSILGELLTRLLYLKYGV